MIGLFARNLTCGGRFLPARVAMLLAISVVVACLLFTSSASAQTTNWTGAVDDNWFNAGNWDNGIPNSAAFSAIVGAPSPTDFNGNVTLGSLSVLSGGILNVSDGDNFNFAAAGSLSNAGQINIGTTSDFQFLNTVTNNGTITVNGAGTASDLELINDTTVTGTGSIFLNGANARISDSSSAATLFTNGATHTIRGNGQVAANTMALLNNGIITADVAGQTMVVDPASNATNTGVLRAEAGGVLRLNAAAYANTGGTIASAGGQVQLVGASITGGLVTGGDVVVTGTSAFTDLTTDAAILVNPNVDLGINGTVTNNGTITVVGSGSPADIKLQGPATLSGTGTVFLNGANARISDSLSTATLLTNGVGHTIRGHGQVGFNVITNIVNNGVVKADVAGQTLIVDPNSTMTNTGVLRAEAGATLRLNGASYTNSAGTIEAIGEDSLVTAVGATFQGHLGNLRAVDGQLLLGEGIGNTSGVNSVYEFFGTAYTGVFNDGGSVSNGALGDSAPGELRSNFFGENQGVFRIGDGLTFTAIVSHGQTNTGSASNTGTIVAGAGSTFAMGATGDEVPIIVEGAPNPVPRIDAYFPLVSTGTLAGSGTIKNSLTPGAPSHSGTVTDPAIDTDDIISEGFIKPGDNPGETGTLTLRAQDIFLGDSNVIEIELGAGVSDAVSLITDENPVALNGSLEVSLLSGFAGGSFDIVTAVNGLTGTFDTLTLPTLSGGLDWIVEYGANAVTIEIYLPGDFDEDGDVDGRDFLVWQRGGSPTPFSGIDLAAWQNGYGIVTSPLVASSTAVPEPSTSVLLSLATVVGALAARRRFAHPPTAAGFGQ